MIYFLVNNNYHLIDVYEHCNNLKDYKKCLIQIPHTLDTIDNNKNFVDIFTYKTPFEGVKNFFNIFNIKKIERQIKKKLIINKDDILFVYTEFEILNQYIISLFKKAGARIYILNEGFATYLTYGVKSESNLPIKYKMKLFYTKYIIGYNFVKYLYYNNLVFPQIADKYIDGVLLYLNVNILRNISKTVITKNTRKLVLNEKKAIFLNEMMYKYYCSNEEYKDILDDILFRISTSFEEVYFKFHPRETEENRKWQIEIINKFDNIQIIKENLPFENLLYKYNSKYIYSYFSAALFNVNAMGAIPVYIAHLYENISQNDIVQQINTILENSGYKFINKTFDNIEYVGFKSKLEDNSKSIKDFVI